MTTGAEMGRKKKSAEPPPPDDEKGTIYTTTARLTPAFMYRLKQIASRESLRAGRRIPVGEIIERQMDHWVAEQWAEIRTEERPG